MASGEKITLTNRELVKLARGLNSLDAVKSGKGDEVVPLEFDAKTGYRLGRAADAVSRAKLPFDRESAKKRREHGVVEDMEKTEANALKIDKLNAVIEPMLDEEVTLDGILLIKLGSLLTRPPSPDAKKDEKPRTNPIPQSVINQLMPIIEPEEA